MTAHTLQATSRQPAAQLHLDVPSFEVTLHLVSISLGFCTSAQLVCWCEGDGETRPGAAVGVLPCELTDRPPVLPFPCTVSLPVEEGMQAVLLPSLQPAFSVFSFHFLLASFFWLLILLFSLEVCLCFLHLKNKTNCLILSDPVVLTLFKNHQIL